MATLPRLLRIGLQLLSALLLAFASLGVSGPQPPAAQAAPQSGGTFTVTSAADDATSDASLSLREALLVVRGGTGPAGLNRPVSPGEKAALAGCSFTGDNINPGSCGPGIANSIVFTGSLGLHPVITLTASLPSITNTAPTTIDGSVNGVFPIISATGLLTGTDALLITSNNNSVLGLTITGAPHDDLRITGNSNQVLTGTVLLAAGRYGLLVDGGDLNLIESALVGTNKPIVCLSTQNNQQGGIVLANSSIFNTIQFATVACNGGTGVRFDGSGTADNTIISSTVTGQAGHGIEIVNGASYNHILADNITSNGQDGVLISGAATQANMVVAGYGGLSCVDAVPNFISGNALAGVRLEAGANSNLINGNLIGLTSDGSAAFPNGGPGVDVDSAPNTHIGDQPCVGNTIGGNLGPGIRFNNTYGGSVGNFNIIGASNTTGGPVGNGGPGVELINTSNTAVVALLVMNNSGAGIAVEGATSTGDLIVPYTVGRNGGLPIDLGNDGHTPNGSHFPPGPNDWLNYPVITATSGGVITGTACFNCTVLIYLVTGNPAAPGGTALQSWSATADGSGHWSANLGGYTSVDVTLLACTAPCSRPYVGVPSHSNTSEFSPRPQLWLPLMRR